MSNHLRFPLRLIKKSKVTDRTPLSSLYIQIEPRLCANYRASIATLDPFAFPGDTPFLFLSLFSFFALIPSHRLTGSNRRCTLHTRSVQKRREEGNYDTRRVVTVQNEDILAPVHIRHVYTCGWYGSTRVSKLLKRVFASAEERIVALKFSRRMLILLLNKSCLF